MDETHLEKGSWREVQQRSLRQLIDRINSEARNIMEDMLHSPLEKYKRVSASALSVSLKEMNVEGKGNAVGFLKLSGRASYFLTPFCSSTTWQPKCGEELDHSSLLRNKTRFCPSCILHILSSLR